MYLLQKFSINFLKALQQDPATGQLLAGQIPDSDNRYRRSPAPARLFPLRLSPPDTATLWAPQGFPEALEIAFPLPPGTFLQGSPEAVSAASSASVWDACIISPFSIFEKLLYVLPVFG